MLLDVEARGDLFEQTHHTPWRVKEGGTKEGKKVVRTAVPVEREAKRTGCTLDGGGSRLGGEVS